MRSLRLAMRATRELGLHPMLLFGVYELKRRMGWLRLQTPIHSWDTSPLHAVVRDGIPTESESYCTYRQQVERSFFFPASADLGGSLSTILEDDEKALIDEAEEILTGRFRLFGGQAKWLGFPPNWGRLPVMGVSHTETNISLERHWTEFESRDLPGDIKLLWEPARFGWIYTLGRAFRLSGDSRYVVGFWNLLESWRLENKPNAGPHWMSAQEVALRLMALVFGLYAFFPYFAEQTQHLVTLAEVIAVHANRIPPTLQYSRAQGNNHLITESVALYTIGLLFPEFRKAVRWRAMGKRWLVSAVEDQVFPDGGYVQHSLNYHRLAIQATLWAIRLGALNDDPFPEKTIESLRRSVQCLHAFVDRDTGRVPNFGSNDGALILPLTTCPFHDYRPVVQLAHQVLTDEDPFGKGPWDEACFWFGLGRRDGMVSEVGREADSISPGFEVPVGRPSYEDGAQGVSSSGAMRSFPNAGMYLLRGKAAWGWLRCARFTHRPGHSDQLHLDLWWRGYNIARDAGTFLYNGAAPWENGLATAGVHNTIIVDEAEPMRRAGRFLWLNWAQGTVLGRWSSPGGRIEMISAEHSGYSTLGVIVRRTLIRAGDQHWLVVDELLGRGQHRLRSGWLLPDDPWRVSSRSLIVESPVGMFEVEFEMPSVAWGLYRAGEIIAGENVAHDGDVFGWYSPTYACKEPSLYFAASQNGKLPLRLISRWSLGDVDRDELRIEWIESTAKPTSISRITYLDEVLKP